jgi:hypothetical protein
LLEQICDEKSRPRGSGPLSQPAVEVTASGGMFSSTFSSWGKKLNSALDSGKAKVRNFLNRFSFQYGHPKFRLTSLSDTLSPSKQKACKHLMLRQLLRVHLSRGLLLLLVTLTPQQLLNLNAARALKDQKKISKASV